MSPLVAILAGGSVAVVITLVVIIAIAIKRCPRRRPPAESASYALGSHVSDTSPKETVSTFSRPSPASEERNPDLIPLKEGKESSHLVIIFSQANQGMIYGASFTESILGNTH